MTHPNIWLPRAIVRRSLNSFAHLRPIMEAHVRTVREILHSGDQFLVPFFQRQYSWTKKEWHNLYRDVVALIESGDVSTHFLGPLVFTPFHHIPGDGPRYQLIDGQQRLTTLTLALAALRDVARLKDLADFADEIHEDYLVHRRRQDLQRFKVVPRLEDRRSYDLAINGNAPGVVTGTGIIGCHSFFKRAWRNPIADAGLPMAQRILTALTARLSLVAITVDGENPYEIFESLNWKGLPLEESDLIRNYLFMQVQPADQATFHEMQWKPYEARFESVGRYDKVPPTQFYRNYLMRDGRYCPNKSTYVEFKRQNSERPLTTVEQVTELQHFATFELWLQRPEFCDREYLRERLVEIQQLDISTAHPLLLNLLDRHDRGYLNRDELDECLRDLASFVIRRTICGESTRPYGRWFTEAIPMIATRPSMDLRRYWLDKGWPDDATFIGRFAEFPIYIREKKKCRHLLEQLEHELGHREAVNMDNLSIEHVLPQTVDDDEAGRTWQAELGASWTQEHERWVHTLGNLTLTGINPELGNKTYATKNAMFSRSNVSLNSYFGGVARWDGAQIRKRGIELGRVVASLWPRPEGQPYFLPSPGPEDFFDEMPAEESHPPLPVAHGSLRVVIHCSMLGENDHDEIIQERKDALTHAKFIGRLIEVFGPTMSEKLQQIPVARGNSFSLTANPERDFINPAQGTIFSHKLVPGTSLYLFTNTDKGRKAKDIINLASRLGFPDGSIEVS